MRTHAQPWFDKNGLRDSTRIYQNLLKLMLNFFETPDGELPSGPRAGAGDAGGEADVRGEGQDGAADQEKDEAAREKAQGGQEGEPLQTVCSSSPRWVYFYTLSYKWIYR